VIADGEMGHPPEEIRAVPLRHPGRWVGTAVLLVLGAMLVHDITTNPRFGWGIVGNLLLLHAGRARRGEDT